MVCGQCRRTGYEPANRRIPFTLAQPVLLCGDGLLGLGVACLVDAKGRFMLLQA